MVFGSQIVAFGLSGDQLFVIALAVASVCLYKKHMKEQKSKFKMQGGYSNMSPLKHDFVKDLLLQILPVLLVSSNSAELFNFSNPYENIVSKAVLTFFYYLIYYHLVEPYVANSFMIF